MKGKDEEDCEPFLGETRSMSPQPIGIKGSCYVKASSTPSVTCIGVREGKCNV